jgi:hypothetical protein
LAHAAAGALVRMVLGRVEGHCDPSQTHNHNGRHRRKATGTAALATTNCPWKWICKEEKTESINTMDRRSFDSSLSIRLDASLISEHSIPLYGDFLS